MLESIKIANFASYGPANGLIEELRKINFFYGTNGSGKTTISRVIDLGGMGDCQLRWLDGRPLECLVYNRDFVEKNFASKMAGIFTLGEQDVDAHQKISDTKLKIEDAEKDLLRDRFNLEGADGRGGKRAELLEARRVLEEECWKEVKIAHEGNFAEVFRGFRGNKSAFCDKLLGEIANNSSALFKLEDLTARATTVFSDDLTNQELLQIPEFSQLEMIESEDTLKKRIVGSGDIEIGKLVDLLKSSDWVRDGLRFLQESDGKCPFCQQPISDELASKLTNYFDDVFEGDLLTLTRARAQYLELTNRYLSSVDKILNSQNRRLDVGQVKKYRDVLSARFALNIQLMDDKIREPSIPVSLEINRDYFRECAEFISHTNQLIRADNAVVENLAAERQAVKNEAWKYFAEAQRERCSKYYATKRGTEVAINNLETRIEGSNQRLNALHEELRQRQSALTSVEPTVNEINRILDEFGFRGFQLVKVRDEESMYGVVRLDGSDATMTLSEGEKSFVTFLYFFHLLEGMLDGSPGIGDRIVVFDDPVSSLDSEVLFIVSTLIRRVIDRVLKGDYHVKQVFVLTHNVYFHKEVSFQKSKRGVKATNQGFWSIRKVEGESVVVPHYSDNPISTHYDLLWREVREGNWSPLTLQNTLRRILENYFKITGNIEIDLLIEKFHGREKSMCKSLISWVNDGSHYVYDDLYVSLTTQEIESYLEVFRKIFAGSGHLPHYNMMMRIENEGDSVSGPGT